MIVVHNGSIYPQLHKKHSVIHLSFTRSSYVYYWNDIKISCLNFISVLNIMVIINTWLLDALLVSSHKPTGIQLWLEVSSDAIKVH